MSTLLLEGPFESDYSLAIVNRNLARALAGLGVALRLHQRDNTTAWNPAEALPAIVPRSRAALREGCGRGVGRCALAQYLPALYRWIPRQTARHALLRVGRDRVPAGIRGVLQPRPGPGDGDIRVCARGAGDRTASRFRSKWWATAPTIFFPRPRSLSTWRGETRSTSCTFPPVFRARPPTFWCALSARSSKAVKMFA